MEIKIITCHDVYNAGSSLQSYALMTYLKNLGHVVEIIDYKPDYLSGHYDLLAVRNPRYKKNVLLHFFYVLAKLPHKLLSQKRKKFFDDFKREYLNVTKVKYASNSELKNNLPQADIYITGSDQIWNTLFENGKDPAFYLDFVPEDRVKVSYAASFSTDMIQVELKQNITEWLKRLTAVSVRETSGLHILEELGIKEATQVLDPVFLHNKNFWKNMCIRDAGNQKYILVYDFDRSAMIRDISIDIAKQYGLKIYTVFSSKYADRLIKNIGPFEFLNFIKNADFVISNSFHASAFSIIFEKEFLVINRKESINIRMIDLLKLFNLSERLITEAKEIYNLPPINYNEINMIVKKQIEHSQRYIEQVLEKRKNDR